MLFINSLSNASICFSITFALRIIILFPIPPKSCLQVGQLAIPQAMSSLKYISRTTLPTLLVLFDFMNLVSNLHNIPSFKEVLQDVSLDAENHYRCLNCC
eukprot:NODE_261_length_12589_cov_0.423139.p12 type:complete len:100 gc:universal NODE_261_length_12589_cov_0.423139:9912-9613(-)